MAKHVIIVESPAKVKPSKNFLAPSIRCWPALGIYAICPKTPLVWMKPTTLPLPTRLLKARNAWWTACAKPLPRPTSFYLAPDPDREGEAIAWHIAELVRGKNTNIKRIAFNEITAKAVKEALDNPRELNAHLFDAQQARRVLDRLVGYKISPLLWKTVKAAFPPGACSP